MCVTCRANMREYKRAKKGGYYQWLKDDDDPPEVQEYERLILDDGRRRCTIRRCPEIIPPVDAYRWKMCEGCRKRTRLRARELKRESTGYRAVVVSDGDDVEDIPLARKLELKKQIQNLKGLKLLFQGRTVASVDTRAQRPPSSSCPMPPPIKPSKNKISSVLLQDNVHRVQSYQTFKSLLEDFHSHLSTFIKAQMFYLQLQSMNELRRKPDGPLVFTFEGEFSIVADPAGGDVGSRLTSMQEAIGEHMGLAFIPSGINVDPAGRVTGLFSCLQAVSVPLPCNPVAKSRLSADPHPEPQPRTNDSAPNVLIKRMRGELQLVVSWDRSHIYFPGLRTVVNFYFIG